MKSDLKRPFQKNTKKNDEAQPVFGFLTTDFPAAGKPEIVFVGRSNAGKSSLINALTERRFAHVSRAPGKTRLIGFIPKGSYWYVDLPGYGYATRSHSQRQSWKDMIENYFRAGRTITVVVLLMDIRREWEEDEELLIEWLKNLGFRWCLVLTKKDQLGYGKTVDKVRKFKLKHRDAVVQTVSSLEKDGVVELEEFLFRTYVKDLL